MLEITLRLIASLAIVVGLLLLLAKVSSKRFKGAPGAMIRVLHRQPLSRSSAISVVAVGDRVLVLGSTEQQINVLTEIDPERAESLLLAAPTTDQDGEDAPLLSEDQRAAPAPTHTTVPSPDFAATLAQVRGLTVASEATPRRTAGAHRAPRPSLPVGTVAGSRGMSMDRSRLQGSILSRQTWRQAFAAVGRRAS